MAALGAGAGEGEHNAAVGGNPNGAKEAAVALFPQAALNAVAAAAVSVTDGSAVTPLPPEGGGGTEVGDGAGNNNDDASNRAPVDVGTGRDGGILGADDKTNERNAGTLS